LFYNDIAEEGTNELEGIVFADVLLRSDPSETVVLQYCAFRSNDADFSDSLALIPEESGGNDCSRFDIQAEFDTPYAVSIELDREAGTLIFSANDAVNTFAIPTPIFRADGAIPASAGRSSGGSTAIVNVDFAT